jgi:epoxyqueuosine reductase
MGNRVFGCDDCLAVCPWNKFASRARETKLALRPDLNSAALVDLVALDDEAFRLRFAGTPVKRTGHTRFLRNVLIAIGNSGDPGLASAAIAHLAAASPLVRGAAVWALRQLLDPSAFARLKEERLAAEADSAVREEWA